MNEKEITKQLNDEYQKFEHSIYAGEVPEGLVQNFITGVMVIAPQNHKISCDAIRAIMNKTEKELTVADLSMVIKVVFNIPFKELYADLFEALDRHKQVEDFVLVYNKKVSEFQIAFTRKKDALMNLAGVNGKKPILGIA